MIGLSCHVTPSSSSVYKSSPETEDLTLERRSRWTRPSFASLFCPLSLVLFNLPPFDSSRLRGSAVTSASHALLWRETELTLRWETTIAAKEWRAKTLERVTRATSPTTLAVGNRLQPATAFRRTAVKVVATDTAAVMYLELVFATEGLKM